ncbi:MAG TPA: acetate/propionate family kinase [Candidatus Acidoferrales bacterium]|jgi:acetate kinase
MSGDAILVLNSGSSSLKFGVYSAAETGDPRPIYRGEIEGIAGSDGKICVKDGGGKTLGQESRSFPQQSDAAKAVGETLSKLKLSKFNGIGHRVVHGGPSLTEHQKITPEVLDTMERASVFAPLHMPAALELIRQMQWRFPGVAQFACFDTAFHRTLPDAAARLPLPQSFWDAGVRKYGFHGLSCESILHALGPQVPRRMIVAHLGNGASVNAILDGKSVDTTMGLTPTGGIVMGTRPGDLDPGVMLYLLASNTADVDGLAKVLDKHSGLLGISGKSSDMRELHKVERDDPRARLAIEMFVRAAKKAIGGYVAVLGGLELLVFAGGIGENDAAVRAAICEGMEIFGVRLDEDANCKNEREINRCERPVSVRVIESDEDGQIARHVARLLQSTTA